MNELERQSWQTLHCLGCDAVDFVTIMELRVKSGGGSTTSQTGWQCASCGQKADMPGMQRKLMVAQRRRELEVLEAELEQEQDEPVGNGRERGYADRANVTR